MLNLNFMRYIEPHAHMVSRTTDDYERMALAGCEAVCRTGLLGGLRPEFRGWLLATIIFASFMPSTKAGTRGEVRS